MDELDIQDLTSLGERCKTYFTYFTYFSYITYLAYCANESYLEQCKSVYPNTNRNGNPLVATGKNQSILLTPGDVA
jgi:hypothetical protein